MAQITTLLTLALLAVVMMAPRSAVKAPIVQLPPPPTMSNGQPTQGEDAPKSTEPEDWTTLAAALDASREPIAGATTTVAAKPDGSTTTTAQNNGVDSDNPDEPRPQPAPPGWQYLGYARFSDGRLAALVTINAVQRFVRTGMQFDAYLISRITPSRLLLERDNQRFEVVRSKPAPFSAGTAMASTPPLPGGASVQNRNAQLEQQRRQLEEQRNRRLQEARQPATDADPGGTQRP